MLQCAHVVSRKNLTLRWDPINALCLCKVCHIYWQHKEPLEFTDWFREKFPGRNTYIMVTKNILMKRNLDQYKELLKDIKARDIRKLSIGIKVTGGVDNG